MVHFMLFTTDPDYFIVLCFQLRMLNNFVKQDGRKLMVDRFACLLSTFNA